MDLATALALKAQSTAARGRSLTGDIGTVTAYTATTVTVTVSNGGSMTVLKSRQYAAPAINDTVVLLGFGGTWYAAFAINAAPVAPPEQPDEEAPSIPPKPKPPPPKPPATTTPRPPAKPKPKPPSNVGTTPNPKPTQKSKTFKPIWTGSYRGGWRGDTKDLYQGDWTGRGSNYGCAYYGNGPSALSGIAVKGTVRIKRIAGGAYGAQHPTLRLLGAKSRPGGAPGYSATIRGPALAIGQTATITLPVAWVTRLLNGSSGGIGIGVGGSSPYVGLAGKGTWSAAFELTLTYKS